MFRVLLRTLSCALALAVSAPGWAAQEVRFWHSMSGALGAQLDALVARFNDSQSDIRVEALYKGDYETVLREVLAAKGGPDAPQIAQIYDAGTAAMMHRPGAIRPVWQVMAESGEPFRADAFLPAVASYYSDASGRLLALPFNTSTPVLYYNKAHFRRAKIDPDKAPRTWYEMPAVLGELRESGSECPYVSAWPTWIHLENMSAWHNQEFATRSNGYDGTDAKLTFNTQLMIRHVSMLSSWAKSRYYIYGGRGDEAERRFAKGECSVLTSSSASFAALAAQPDLEFGVAPLPYYDDFNNAPYNTLIGGAGLWVLGGVPAAQTRAVAKFFAFLMKPDVQAEWHQKTGYIPVTRAAYELSKKQGFYEKNPALETAIRTLTSRPLARETRGIRLGAMDRIRNVIDEELEQVWEGRKTPKDALDTAVARGNVLLREFEGVAASRAPAERVARRR